MTHKMKWKQAGHEWYSMLIPENDKDHMGSGISCRCAQPPCDGFYWARFYDNPAEWVLAYYQNIALSGTDELRLSAHCWKMPNDTMDYRQRVELLEFAPAVWPGRSWELTLPKPRRSE